MTRTAAPLATLLLLLVPAVALDGCGPAGKPPDVLGRAVLKEWPKVPWATAIEPESVLVSVDAEGKMYLDSQAVTPENLRERIKKPPTIGAAFPGSNTDPVLLEVQPALSFLNLQVILEDLCRANRVNLAYLVSTPDGPRGLVLPMPVDTTGLAFFDGRTMYPEPASSPLEVSPEKRSRLIRS